MGCPFFVLNKICKESYMNLKGCFNPSAWKDCSVYQQLIKEVSEKRMTRILKYTENIRKIKQRRYFLQDPKNPNIMLRKQYGYEDELYLKVRINYKDVLIRGINLTMRSSPALVIFSDGKQIHKNFNQIKRIAIEVD